MKVAPGRWFLIIIKRPWAQLVGQIMSNSRNSGSGEDTVQECLKPKTGSFYRCHTWLNFQWLLFTVMLSVRCNAFWTLTSPCGSEHEGRVSDVNLLSVAEFELWVTPMALAFLFMPGGTDPGWRTRWQALLSKCARRRWTSPGLTETRRGDVCRPSVQYVTTQNTEVKTFALVEQSSKSST